MKKTNLFLVCVSFIAVALYLFFAEFEFGVTKPLADHHAIFMWLAQVLFFLVFLFCVLFKNTWATLWLILPVSGFFAFEYLESMFTFFPLIIGFWFLKAMAQGGSKLLLAEYIVAVASSAALGLYVLTRYSSIYFLKEEKKVLYLFFAVLALLAVLHFASCFLHKKQPQNRNKNAKQRPDEIDNYLVPFIFLQTIYAVIAIWFLLIANYSDQYNLLPFIFLIANCIGLPYMLFKVNALRGKRVNFEKLI